MQKDSVLSAHTLEKITVEAEIILPNTNPWSQNVYKVEVTEGLKNYWKKDAQNRAPSPYGENHTSCVY